MHSFAHTGTMYERNQKAQTFVVYTEYNSLNLAQIVNRLQANELVYV